jgi:hypothetical protein
MLNVPNSIKRHVREIKIKNAADQMQKLNKDKAENPAAYEILALYPLGCFGFDGEITKPFGTMKSEEAFNIKINGILDRHCREDVDVRTKQINRAKELIKTKSRSIGRAYWCNKGSDEGNLAPPPFVPARIELPFA